MNETPAHHTAVGPDGADALLDRFLRQWLGAWPPSGDVRVVGCELRDQPAWDGAIRPFVGVETADGAVLSVSPRHLASVRALGTGVDQIGQGLAAALGRPSWQFGKGVFRWSTNPTPSDDPGVWLPNDDPRVPPWLTPFNQDVLVGFVGRPDRGEVAAGVGRKIHNPAGHELAVVTEEGHRGEGWAQRLVTQAARRVLADDAIPIYLHAEDNTASARTADACGFPDRGWRILGLFPGAPA